MAFLTASAKLSRAFSANGDVDCTQHCRPVGGRNYSASRSDTLVQLLRRDFWAKRLQESIKELAPDAAPVPLSYIEMRRRAEPAMGEE